MPLRLAVLDPGHFHAALPLRSADPRLDATVQVHAPDGPELARFLALVERFNRRAQAPTAWRLQVHRSADPLASLLAAPDVDVVVLAGRNRGKLARIRALAAAGRHVLADKPWVVEPEDVAHFAAMQAAPAHWADLMTGRHDPWSQLFAALARDPAVAGEPDASRGPVLELSSVHHLAKEVDGAPLIRPPWYFDVAVQGEGLIDVTTHQVDLAMRVAGHRAGDGLVLERARRWSTAVPESDFRTITGAAAFPVGAPVRDGALQLMANGELDFRCAGVPVRVRAEWHLRAPAGHGDAHGAVRRGRRADIVLEGGAAGTRLAVVPHGDADLRAAVAAAAPGAEIVADDGRLLVTPARRSGHEEHFAELLSGFLDALPRPQPAAERLAIAERYRLLAEALALARRA